MHNFAGPEFDSQAKDTFALEFLDLVRRQGPDVLCLQEYIESPNVKTTDSLLLMGYNHHYGSRGNPDKPKGTAVFSRLPFAYVKRIDPQKVIVELLTGEQAIRLCCVHMDSFNFSLSDRKGIEQAKHGHVDSLSSTTLHKAKSTVLKHATEWEEQLRPVVTECSVPLIVAGDMNDIPGSWLYARLADHLHDTYRDQGRGIGTTFHGSFPRFRIDMVFRNDRLRTLSYRRLRTRISDHYPVIVSLEPATP